jgi:hypothetical protein
MTSPPPADPGPFAVSFNDLAHAATAETRQALANRLADSVASYWQVQVRSSEDTVVRNLDAQLEALLISPQKCQRLAGIAAFSALVNSSNETFTARVMRTTKAFQMLETSVVRMYGDDLDMASATASLYAAFF